MYVYVIVTSGSTENGKFMSDNVRTCGASESYLYIFH